MPTMSLTPTADAFHALARSSPWRWTTLHFRHRSAFNGPCEAWVHRPGELLVRLPDGTEHRESGLPYSSSVSVVFSSSAGSPAPPVPERRLPHEATPAYRPDGLVAARPDEFGVDYDDPMYGNYSWVAMLDPVELSHHVAVTNLRAEEVGGRPAWRADLRAEPGYAPRCGGNCCELLYSEAGRVCEVDDPADAYIGPGADYPDHYDVALDLQTGVVVRCLPIGGAPGAPWLENDILEVG